MKVFISGATSGIGLELVKLYLDSGHFVGLCGRDLSKLDPLLKGHQNLATYQVDVACREAIIQAIDHFTASQGNHGLDLVIANAGRSVGKKQALPDWEIGAEVLQTNTMGVWYTFEAALKHMLKQKHGQIVAISSVAGFVGVPGAAAYSASKAAVTKLCESLSVDLKPYNIFVTNICPGFIDTPLTRKNQHKMPFLISGQKGALKIKKAIEKQKNLYIFPLPMKLAIIILDKMPRVLYRFLISKITALFLSKGVKSC